MTISLKGGVSNDGALQINDVDILNITSTGTSAASGKTLTANAVSAGAVGQAGLAANVVGNGPAFIATIGSQAMSGGVVAQLTATETKDSNDCFASSTFTPNVAGYYQINLVIYTNQPASFAGAYIYFNGAAVARHLTPGLPVGDGSGSYITASTIVYANGTTDNIKAYGVIIVGGYSVIGGTFSGCLLRSA